MTAIKIVTEEKEKKLKSLIVFLSAIKSTATRGWGERGKKKKLQKNLQNKSKNKNNICFS